MAVDVTQARIRAPTSASRMPIPVARRTDAACSSTTVSGSASLANATAGCSTGNATYRKSRSTVVLKRRVRPMPRSRAATISGREP